MRGAGPFAPASHLWVRLREALAGLTPATREGAVLETQDQDKVARFTRVLQTSNDVIVAAMAKKLFP